jgi:ankyrin repeat domain-containing protein 27
MENHGSLINEVGSSNWIILVPKISQITTECCNDHEFLLSHVLVGSEDLPKTHFTNLIGVDVTINDRHIRVKDSNNLRSLILFEEMFYTKEMQKFKILCIETPLCQKFIQKCASTSKLVQNVAESIELLRACGDKSMRKIDNAISNFTSRIQKASDYMKLKTNVKLLFEYCVNLISNKRNKNIDPFLLMNLKIAIEYYLMEAVYDKLFDAISTQQAEENQKFNKILRKLSDITIEDLNITKEPSPKITENLNIMRIELVKISGCKSSLDKLYCIKNVIDAMSSCKEDDKLMATDELLPALVFVIIKTNFFQWIPTLVFIKEFNLSQMLSPENQSAGSVMFYILTTLEAVIYFIETNENLPMKNQQLLEFKKIDEIASQEDYIQHLLQYVKENNEIQLMKLINVNYTSFISRASESPDDTNLCHPLCTCSSCRFIIEESESNVNVKSRNDLTMIHIASAYNIPKMVTILMNLGCDVYAQDSNGWTSLHFAAHRGHQKVLFLLLHGKSSINTVTKNQQTPLLLASIAGHDCCVKALLYFADHTCLSLNLNAQDTEGNTALHYASIAGFESIVESLLEYQAKVTIKNNLGKIASDYANSAMKKKLESALKYQAEELPGNEQEFVFISNEDLADVC